MNDTIAGDPVAVTYCPLTGTAQGFDLGQSSSASRAACELI